MITKRSIKLIVVTIILILVFNLLIFAEDGAILKEDRLYRGDPKKDPILASSISWYIPGGGQFYAGNYKKGLLFLTLEASLFIYTLGLVTDYSYDLGNGFLMDAKNDVSTKDKELAWSLGTVLLGLHIYNIVDAYNGNYIEDIVRHNSSLSRLSSP